MWDRLGFDDPRPRQPLAITGLRGSAPDSSSTAPCATVVGNREAPSGKCRLMNVQIAVALFSLVWISISADAQSADPEEVSNCKELIKKGQGWKTVEFGEYQFVDTKQFLLEQNMYTPNLFLLDRRTARIHSKILRKDGMKFATYVACVPSIMAKTGYVVVYEDILKHMEQE